MAESVNNWVIIPAAGSGKRMGAEVPKQYLSLHGHTVLEHTISRFINHPDITGIVLAIAEDDVWWKTLKVSYPRLHVVAGGTERCDSVLNALDFLQSHAAEDDWVLVHDAARPCLRHEDIDLLLETLRDHPVGGLLGLPVSDTVKRCDVNGVVMETVPRDNLWRALTPQMFHVGPLHRAISAAIEAGATLTDESSAMEHARHQPLMVEGHPDNIKITRPQDLILADLYLAQQLGSAKGKKGLGKR